MKITLLAVLFYLVTAVMGDSDFKRLLGQGDSTSDTSDYVKDFFQLLNGLKADDYVPGSINCGLDVIAT